MNNNNRSKSNQRSNRKPNSKERNSGTNSSESQHQEDFVIGRHAASETLHQLDNDRINKIFIQDSLSNDFSREVYQIAQKKNLMIQKVPKQKLDKLSDDQNHQGIIVAITPYAYATIDDLFDHAKAQDHDPFFVILDNLEDPHNLGSIMRTADAVGVDGIIIPKHRSVGLTSTVAKVSTGAIEHVPVARVTNLTQTVKLLKERGLWIFGTAMDGKDYRTWNATGSIGLVIGSEGKGISPGLQKVMDEILTIPMIGHVQSLNASVAAGVLMYQAFNSRHPLGK